MFSCLHCCAVLSPGQSQLDPSEQIFHDVLVSLEGSSVPTAQWKVVLVPSPDQHRVWGAGFNIPVVKCSLQSSSLLGLLCDAVLGGIFQTHFTPPHPALVELQRCESDRIQSFWQKSMLSAFPLEFLGHSVVSRSISPSGHHLPRNVVIRLAGRPRSCHWCRLCAVCHSLSG